MIVEDGTGIFNSNSYVSLDFADEYFFSRGYSEWENLEEKNKEQLLVKATDYIDNIYQWLGSKKTSTQSLRFPRVNLTDYEGIEIVDIPLSLKYSVCDVAFECLKGTELFGKEDTNGNVISEKIGQLAFTYEKSVKELVKNKSIFDSVNTRLRGLYKIQNDRNLKVGKILRV